VTPLRTRLMRAVAMALLVVAFTANVAAADEGGSNLDTVPYDPGFPSEGNAAVPYDPGLPSEGNDTVPYDPGFPSEGSAAVP
jgi:hypothetical protein